MINSQGSVEFKSDNISTISILKDVITKLATQRKIALDITVSFKLTFSSPRAVFHPPFLHLFLK